MLTPHPSGSNLLERLSGREALVDAGACKAYAEVRDGRRSAAGQGRHGEVSWKLIAFAPRAVIEAALLAHEDALDWDREIVLSGSEIAEDKPEDWQLEAWLGRKPGEGRQGRDCRAVSGQGPRLIEEKLPDIDWLTHSQQELEPIAPGGFMCHARASAAGRAGLATSPFRQPGLRHRPARHHCQVLHGNAGRHEAARAGGA